MTNVLHIIMQKPKIQIIDGEEKTSQIEVKIMIRKGQKP